MENLHIVYKDYLYLPANGKQWVQNFCVLFAASKIGKARLEAYETNKTTNPPFKVFDLENCIKVVSEGSTYFKIITEDAEYEFVTLDSNFIVWLKAVQSVAISDRSSMSLVKDNDLYCSNNEEVFYVKLHPSTASAKCGLDSKLYILVFTANSIQLRTCEDSSLVYSWPYCFIRRYGYKQKKFMFDAGRKCGNGEGIFYLEHPSQNEIFKCMINKIKAMKNLLASDLISQMMESGETNPDLKNSCLRTMESNLFKTKLNESFTSKHKEMNVELDNSRSSSDYDFVENRNSAWKTLGTDDVNHFEIAFNQDSDTFSNIKDIENQNICQIQAANVTNKINNSDISSDYDKLHYFRSCNKDNALPGYKKVNVSHNELGINLSGDVYDDIQFTSSEIRLADDQYLGYAIIKKDFSKNKGQVTHYYYNNEPYATVLKTSHSNHESK